MRLISNKWILIFIMLGLCVAGCALTDRMVADYGNAVLSDPNSIAVVKDHIVSNSQFMFGLFPALAPFKDVLSIGFGVIGSFIFGVLMGKKKKR